MGTGGLTPYQSNLVQTHLKLAQRMGLEAWRRSRETMEKDEVVSIAYQGLITAAVKFDPDWRPEIPDPNYDPFLAFGAFARTRISGAIMDWQRRQDHVPRGQRKSYKNLQAHGHGAGKSAEELADITGLDPNKIRAITQAVEETAVSLDGSEHSESLVMHAVPPSPVEDSALVANITSIVADAIGELPPLQRSVVVLRYYSGLDLSHIAVELGVSISVVRSSHKEAVDLIHAQMRRAAS